MKAEYRLMWLLMLCLFFLQGCGSMPIGANEILPISQQATVTGIYAVQTGAEPLGQIWQNARGLQVVIWPGARDGSQQLWNFACLVGDCRGEMLRYIAGPGKATTGIRMSMFVEYLKQNGWVQVTGAANVTRVISEAMAVMNGVITGYMVLPIAPGMMDEPGAAVQN